MKSIFSTILLLAALPLGAQNALDPISDDFRNWVKIIGSDEFGGRKPMTYTGVNGSKVPYKVEYIPVKLLPTVISGPNGAGPTLTDPLVIG